MEDVKAEDGQRDIASELDFLTEDLRAAAGMVKLCGRGITLNDGWCPSEEDSYAMDAASNYLLALIDKMRELVNAL